MICYSCSPGYNRDASKATQQKGRQRSAGKRRPKNDVQTIDEVIPFKPDEEEKINIPQIEKLEHRLDEEHKQVYFSDYSPFDRDSTCSMEQRYIVLFLSVCRPVTCFH